MEYGFIGQKDKHPNSCLVIIMKSAEERKKYDENAMCKAYGKRMMFMSIPFIAGMIIDIWHIGIGCLIAWVIWFVMFILLLMDRHKREG